MSLAPYIIRMQDGLKDGRVLLVDSMVADGLTDVFNNYHMGITAENIAEQWKNQTGTR